jgi:hypothetical protein
MFQSYTERYLKSRSKKYCTYEYKLTDSEFGTVSGIVKTNQIIHGIIETVVIREYGKRKLNVAANLVLAFVWCSKLYNLPLLDIIDWNKKYNPLFKPYEEDIQKYLVLL